MSSEKTSCIKTPAKNVPQPGNFEIKANTHTIQVVLVNMGCRQLWLATDQVMV